MCAHCVCATSSVSGIRARYQTTMCMGNQMKPNINFPSANSNEARIVVASVDNNYISISNPMCGWLFDSLQTILSMINQYLKSKKRHGVIPWYYGLSYDILGMLRPTNGQGSQWFQWLRRKFIRPWHTWDWFQFSLFCTVCAFVFVLSFLFLFNVFLYFNVI